MPETSVSLTTVASLKVNVEPSADTVKTVKSPLLAAFVAPEILITSVGVTASKKSSTGVPPLSTTWIVLSDSDVT